MNSPLDWIQGELQSLSDKSLLRDWKTFQPLSEGRCELNGKQLWNFAGNDYLGLAEENSVIEAAKAACESGVGAKASQLVTGRTELHQQLEQELAALKGTEAAVLFPTGYAANFGTITSLIGPEDIVFSDRFNHASLIDGARHTRAKFRVYPHCNTVSLKHDLQKSQSYRRRLIVTDSLFSMDGDVAPLAALIELAEKFDAMLLVDEAHSTGIFGENGAGLIHEQGIAKSPNVISVGTLSKALGAQGGFVAGSRKLCDWLWNRARTSMFSTALAPPVCAAAVEAVRLIRNEPERRHWLLAQSKRVKKELIELGLKVPTNVRGPIIPVIIGSPHETINHALELQERGVYVAAIRPPTVPVKTSRLRISLSYAHGEGGVAALVDAFRVLPARSRSAD